MLPKRLTLDLDVLGLDEYSDKDEIEDAINDYLSDEYGFCVNSWEYEIESDVIFISNIDWDTDED